MFSLRLKNKFIIPILVFTFSSLIALIYTQSISFDLIEGFSSRATYNSIEGCLKKNKKRYEVIENYKLPEFDLRPKYAFSKIDIKGYCDLDICGNIELSFFNDQLMTAVFFPDNFDDYFEHLVEKTSIYYLKENLISLNPIIRIAYGTDYLNRQYVSFVNILIDRKHSNWLQEYS